MAYSNTRDAFHRHTTSVFNSTTINDVTGCRCSFEVRRNAINGDGDLGPTANPAQGLSQMTILRFLDGNGVQSYSASSATLTHTFAKANGNTGTYAQSNMLPGSHDFEAENPEGGFVFQQVYDVEAATPSFTITH